MNITTERKHRKVFFRNSFIHKGLFSPEECATIIEYFKSKQPRSATVVDVDKTTSNNIVSKSMDEVRRGKVVFVNYKEPTLKFAFDKLYETVIWANFGWSVFALEFLQISEYDSETDGGFYKRHRDIIIEQIPQRIVSCVTQLSVKEDYVGCNLVFDSGKSLPTPNMFYNQGDTVFFLSDEPHEVTPIQSGKRYSLTGWFTGPPFWTSDTLPKYF